MDKSQLQIAQSDHDGLPSDLSTKVIIKKPRKEDNNDSKPTNESTKSKL